MFDNLTTTKLGYYVYALINPINKMPFYIGKGKENRVFSHKEEVLNFENQIDNLKKEEIKTILNLGLDIEHIIIRHGLSEAESFLIESTLIDFVNFFDKKLTNIVSGHDSNFYGIKTANEIIRQYNAPKLEKLDHDVIIININKKYAQSKSTFETIYEATKQAWVISETRRNNVKYALSEYQGIIIGVYKIKNWYQVTTNNNKSNNRWGFNGEIASTEISELYLNKSIMHSKKKGAANPVRYKL
jgi:uncharacterized protein